MSVFAPFRFSPVNNWVYFPDWADQVSHDIPFEDGWSGEIELELHAHSEVLVGGARRAATKQAAGEVWPFQLPDGKWAIPPSTLKGAIRALVETVSFAKLGDWIDDKRFGVRDLSPGARKFYGNRLNMNTGRNKKKPVRTRVRAGFLSRSDNGLQLRKCRFARIEYQELHPLLGLHGTELHPELDAGERYKVVPEESRFSTQLLVEPEKARDHHSLKWDGTRSELWLSYGLASTPKNGEPTTKGFVVLTGSPQEYTDQRRQKHFEFFFHDVDSAPTDNAISEHVFQEFLDIHAPDDGREQSTAWKYLNEKGHPSFKPFKDGGEIPIFYLEEKNEIVSFGLAMMFRLAHKLTTRDLLLNSHADHGSATPDLASLIFGEIADETSGRGLKGRVAFDLAVAKLPQGETISATDGNVALLGPKASDHTKYVSQPGDKQNGQLPQSPDQHGNLRLETYATYTSQSDGNPQRGQPVLKGRKIWPASTAANQAYAFDTLPSLQSSVGGKNQEISKSAQVRLWALPKGTTFRTTLRFHNMKHVELGALLWALSFGDDAALRARSAKDVKKVHRIGAGKPLGFGHVSMRFAGGDLRPNKALSESAPFGGMITKLIKEFSDHMEEVAKARQSTWRDSPQINAVLAASDPDENKNLQLRYMSVDQHTAAKKAGRFLPEYP